MTDEVNAIPDSELPNEPQLPTDGMGVPEDITEIGKDSNQARNNDSPETLDEDINQGSDRDRIDPTDMTTLTDQ